MIDATRGRVSKVDLVDINTDKSYRTKKIDMMLIRLEGDSDGGSDEDEDEDEESTPVPRAEVSFVEICQCPILTLLFQIVKRPRPPRRATRETNP